MSGSVVLFRVSSRTNLAGSSPPISFTSSISFASFRLRTLNFSLRSFSHTDPLFSITSALFLQDTRGGIPLRELVRCTEAQKCLFVSPLLAALTHSVSRKSFPCHSYANTRDGGVNIPPVSTSVSLCLCELCGESVALFLRLRNQQLTTNNCRLLFLARSLFSYSYELLFPQALSFDNHPHCPGVWGRPTLQRPHQPANVGGRYIRGRGRRKAGTTAKGIVRAQARRPECTELQRLPRQRHYSGSYPRGALRVSGAAHSDLRLPDGDGSIEERLA